MLKHSFIGRTGQRWKFYVGLLLAISSLVIFFRELSIPGVDNANVVFLSFGLAAFGLMLAIFGARCPKCGAHPVWKAVNEKDIVNWVDWLERQERCPTCGYEPQERRRTPR
jgi:hypothetical protein